MMRRRRHLIKCWQSMESALKIAESENIHNRATNLVAYRSHDTEPLEARSHGKVLWTRLLLDPTKTLLISHHLHDLRAN